MTIALIRAVKRPVEEGMISSVSSKTILLLIHLVLRRLMCDYVALLVEGLIVGVDIVGWRWMWLVERKCYLDVQVSRGLDTCGAL